MQLFSFDDLESLHLEKNTHYMITIVYQDLDQDGATMEIASNNVTDYTTAYRYKYLTANNDPAKIRYNYAYTYGKQNYFSIVPSEMENDSTKFIDQNIVPFIRLGYSPTFVCNTNEIEVVDLKLSPNPSSDFIEVNFDMESSNAVTLSIVDVNGKLHKQRNVSGHQHHEEVFRVSDLPKGVYFMVIQMGESSLSKRFVVQR